MRPSFYARVFPSNRAARYDINTGARDRVVKPLLNGCRPRPGGAEKGDGHHERGAERDDPHGSEA
jgi:hypothetical protein